MWWTTGSNIDMMLRLSCAGTEYKFVIDRAFKARLQLRVCPRYRLLDLLRVWLWFEKVYQQTVCLSASRSLANLAFAKPPIPYVSLLFGIRRFFRSLANTAMLLLRHFCKLQYQRQVHIHSNASAMCIRLCVMSSRLLAPPRTTTVHRSRTGLYKSLVISLPVMTYVSEWVVL